MDRGDLALLGSNISSSSSGSKIGNAVGLVGEVAKIPQVLGIPRGLVQESPVVIARLIQEIRCGEGRGEAWEGRG